jgi:HK97 gp10 family phage protein
MTFKAMGIEGIDDLMKSLDGAPVKAENILRGTVQGIATKVAKDIRRAAPKGDNGRLKKAKNIKAVRRRPVDGLIFSDVRADGRDAFFWRFVEYGQGGGPAQPFVNPTIEAERPNMPAIYREQFGKRFEKAMKKAGK